MSEASCWECNESFSRDQVFDIPVFRKGFTIQWCFNCAMKQLEFTDYRLIKKPLEYKKFKVESHDDRSERYQNRLEELRLCFEAQIRKIGNIDYAWNDLHSIVQLDEDDGRA